MSYFKGAHSPILVVAHHGTTDQR